MDMPRTRNTTRAPAAPKRRSALDLVLGSRFGKLLGRIGIGAKPSRSEGETLIDLAEALLSVRGRASGPALASAFFDLYEASDLEARHAFLSRIHDVHPIDAAAIGKAIANWQEKRDDTSAQALHEATEAPSQRLINTLNLAPQGTQRLIALRQDLLGVPDKTPGLKALDKEMEDAFEAWFNAGFLELRRIGWHTPASVLEKIIRYEAVHSIEGWSDLRGRVEPMDRRCYGFFHPQMPDEPLIFVEVALTETIPGGIGQIIADERTVIDPRAANCAIFYSISNCQDGLRGIPFGNYLIKRVVGLLCEELPQLSCFATLSPVPGFAKWLAKEQGKDAALPDSEELRRLCARYLTTARSPSGAVLDPVGRFHLGNGARLEAVHADADLSANGLRQSHGLMVNYLYDLDEIEANLFGLMELGTVAASKAVTALVEGEPPAGRRGKSKRAAG